MDTYYYCPICDTGGHLTGFLDRVVICPDCLSVAEVLDNDDPTFDMEAHIEYLNK